MRSAVLILLLATSLNGWAQSLFTNVFSFVNSSGVTQNVKQVSIEPLQAIGVYGDSVIVTNALIFTVKTNTLPVPLLNGYSYRVKYYASVSPEVIGSTFTNYFSTNVSGVVSAADYVTISTNLGSGIYAYSIAQSDARFALIGGGSGGVTNAGGVIAGMLTNANFSTTGTGAITGIIRGITSLTNITTYTMEFSATNPVDVNAMGLGSEVTGRYWWNATLASYTNPGTFYQMWKHTDFNNAWVIGTNRVDPLNTLNILYCQTDTPMPVKDQSWLYGDPNNDIATSVLVGTFISTNALLFQDRSGVSIVPDSLVWIGQQRMFSITNVYNQPVFQLLGNASPVANFGSFYSWAHTNYAFVPQPIDNSGTNAELETYAWNLASSYQTKFDKRYSVGVGFLNGTNGYYGSKFEILNQVCGHYSGAGGTAGEYNMAMAIDGHNGISLGANPFTEHGKDIKSVPWLRIRGSSDNTRPQFQLEGTGKPFIGTVTNGAFFNDGTNVSLAQAGGFAPIAIQGGIGMPVYYYVTNDFIVTNIVITNHVGYSIQAALTNNGIYEIEVQAIARGNQATDRPNIITWITNNVAMGFVYTSRSFTHNGYAVWSSGFEGGTPTVGFILATNTSGLDTFLGNRPISENRPVSGTAQSSTTEHMILLRLTNAPMNLFMSCTALTTGTNYLKAGSRMKVTRIE